MKRFGLVLAAVVTCFAVVTLSAPAAFAQTTGEGSVTGTGATVDGFFTNIVVDAHVDVSGTVASGTVSFTAAGSISVAGPVTCLRIDGNRALLVFTDASFGPVTVEIVDNGPSGSPPDTFFADPFAGSDCSSDPILADGGPLGSGDLVVSEVPPLTSKDQCKRGGWRDFTGDEGQQFRNQGACIKFVNQL